MTRAYKNIRSHDAPKKTKGSATGKLKTKLTKTVQDSLALGNLTGWFAN